MAPETNTADAVRGPEALLTKCEGTRVVSSNLRLIGRASARALSTRLRGITHVENGLPSIPSRASDLIRTYLPANGFPRPVKIRVTAELA